MHAYNQKKAQAKQQIVSKNVFATLEQNQKQQNNKVDVKEETDTEKQPIAQKQKQSSSWADDFEDEDVAPSAAQQWLKQTQGQQAEPQEPSKDDLRKQQIEEEIKDAIGADMLESASEDEKEQSSETQRRGQQIINDKSKQVSQEKQLSKKELKQKELNDLEQIFQSFGINQNQDTQDNQSKNEKKKKKKLNKQQTQNGQIQNEEQDDSKQTDKYIQKIDDKDQLQDVTESDQDSNLNGASQTPLRDPNEVKAQLLAMKKKQQQQKKPLTAQQLAAQEAKNRAQKGKSKEKDSKTFNQMPTR